MDTKDMILELRTKMGLSQDELAEKVFVTRQAVSRWENGETTPNIETLKLLSKLFDVSINTLLGSPRQLICQCCGMPLADGDISRETDGFFNEEYCKWCYADGEYMYHDLDDLIEVCVQMKRDIVGADEYDLGRRRTLNLGHTFGHAVEQCSDFSLLHGEAVAIGMATVTRAAVKRGICGEETLALLLDILHRYGLPTETGYELDKLYEAELVDKKISGGKMHLIVPEKIGQVRMETIPVEALRDWMQDGGIR
mgnify:CR=1 FL=1